MTRVRRTNFAKHARNLRKSGRNPVTAGDVLVPGGEALSNFSITIRTGRGVNLGSNSSTTLEAWLMQFKQYSFSVEKLGDQAHFQGCIRDFDSVARIKSELLEIYRETDPEWCEKNDKHAIKVVLHENWQGLLKYTRKEQLAVYSRGVPVKKFSYGFTKTYPYNNWCWDSEEDNYCLREGEQLDMRMCDCGRIAPVVCVSQTH